MNDGDIKLIIDRLNNVEYADDPSIADDAIEIIEMLANELHKEKQNEAV